MIRLIGIDVDGTLLDTRGQIPQDNNDATHDAVRAGIQPCPHRLAYPAHAVAGASRSSPAHLDAVGSPPTKSLRWWTSAPVNDPSVTVPFSTMNPLGLQCPFISAVNEISPTVIHSVSVS